MGKMLNAIKIGDTTQTPLFKKSSQNKSEAQSLVESYNSIIILLEEFNRITPTKLQTNQLELALKTILFPNKTNIIAVAEAICLERMKHVLQEILNDNQKLDIEVPNVSECLGALMTLGELNVRKKN
jgi:hypothetical protein